MSKKKYKYIVLILLGVGISAIIFLYVFFIGSVTIRTKSYDYCNFEGFQGYSNLEIFPSDPESISEVTNYYYRCADTFMDPTCKIMMECFFADDMLFDAECARLSRIVIEKDGEMNEIQYSETLFKYPAYIAMYDWSSCYEYALILKEENKIIYVFLQGDLQKINKEYMPLSAENENSEFSIYSFNGVFDLKYR